MASARPARSRCASGAATPAAATSRSTSVDVRGGHGRPRRHPPHPGDPGAGPGRALELQGGQVRLVQRRGQRQAAADVHDADEHLRAGRADHRRADEDVSADQGPGDRRLVQLREGQDASRPSSRAPKEADGTRRMFQEDIDRVQEFHKCIECFLCQNVCHVIRDHEENKPRLRRAALLRAAGRAGDAPARHQRPARAAQGASRARLLQHHQVLHRGLPGAHPASPTTRSSRSRSAW